MHFSIAHASRILFRAPEPKRSGTTTQLASATNGRMSGTSDTTVTPGRWPKSRTWRGACRLTAALEPLERRRRRSRAALVNDGANVVHHENAERGHRKVFDEGGSAGFDHDDDVPGTLLEGTSEVRSDIPIAAVEHQRVDG